MLRTADGTALRRRKWLLREVIATVQGRTVGQVLLWRLWVLKSRNLRTIYCIEHFFSWISSAAMKCHSYILKWRHGELWRDARRSLSSVMSCCKCYKLKQQTALTLMFQCTKLLHVSALTVPQSVSTAVQNNRQTKLSSCGEIIRGEHVYSDWSSLQVGLCSRR
jgi:hypothetical protein